MLRQEAVRAFVRDQKTNSVDLAATATVEMRSRDGGLTWFSSPKTMLAVKKRVLELDFPVLSDRQKHWLDMIELPIGYDLRAALRSR